MDGPALTTWTTSLLVGSLQKRQYPFPESLPQSMHAFSNVGGAPPGVKPDTR